MWKSALLSLLLGVAAAAPLAGDAWAEGRHHHRGDYQDQDDQGDRGRGGDNRGRGDDNRGRSGWGQPAAVEPNWNQPHNDYRDRQDNRQQQQEARISVREAAARVRARFGGELISASMEGGTYVLRWRFPNQMVEDIRVDASSGQVYR